MGFMINKYFSDNMDFILGYRIKIGFLVLEKNDKFFNGLY